MFDLQPEESQYLLDTLRAAHTELLHQLHRVDSKDYRQILREQIDLNERLMARIEVAQLTAV